MWEWCRGGDGVEVGMVWGSRRCMGRNGVEVGMV